MILARVKVQLFIYFYQNLNQLQNLQNSLSINPSKQIVRETQLHP
jgi:hypothetical protein